MTPEVPEAIVPPTSAEGRPRPVNSAADERLIERWEKVLSGQETLPPLEVPAEAEEVVDRVLAGRQVLPTERQRILKVFTLQYHHAGKQIAYLQVANKIVILAVGLHQVSLLVRHFSPEQRRLVTIEHVACG